MLLGMTAIANLPQVVVSLYFVINSVFTAMTAADEWSRFSIKEKALRTTSLEGLQRSTYWLSLPWMYGLPLAITSSGPHFLISQSLFVARFKTFNAIGEIVNKNSLAYSPRAALVAVILGIAIVFGTTLIGTKKLQPCILAQNNSLAIAAACHRPDGDEDDHLKKVKWGAIRHQKGKVPGHCCFTSKEVEMPRVGGLYTGI